jgi:trehalose 6-phosphate synthase
MVSDGGHLVAVAPGSWYRSDRPVIQRGARVGRVAMTPSAGADLPVVLLSHRGPVSFGRDESGRTASRGAGGLVTALTGLVSDLPDAVWVCAATSEEDAAVAAEHDGRAVGVALEPEARLVEPDGPGAAEGVATVRLRLVEVEQQAHDDFYTVIANPLLWFLQHGMYGLALAPVLTRREHTAWEDGYVAVNRQFADAVVEEVQARGGRALVMVHDYHFYLVGQEVRERCPEALLSFFLHIPWPGPDAWRVLPPPWRERLLTGLLGNDVVAFHTEGFARNFLLSAQELLGLPVDLEAMTVRVGDRVVAARHYPISIDVAAIRELAATDEVAEQAAALREAFCGGDRQLLLRVDRTDPSKNIVRGFLAFATLLEDHPELVGKVSFLALLQPSRQDVPEYADYLAEIGATVARVNAAHGGEGYQPVDLRLAGDLELAVAAYTVCDVLMVNALADGMNLVAKEAMVVNTRDSVLALSENTGAHQELGAFAVTLHPFDIQQQADALHEALTMDRDLRRARRQAAARVVEENDIAKWLASQLSDLGVRPPGPA